MEQMTREEAWALDDEITKNPPKLGTDGTGFISLREAHLMGYDDVTVNFLVSKAEATHKTPAQIVNELVREKITAQSASELTVAEKAPTYDA